MNCYVYGMNKKLWEMLKFPNNVQSMSVNTPRYFIVIKKKLYLLYGVINI